MLNAKLQVNERINKNGQPYEMLSIIIETKNGELITIHEIFMRESLSQIIKFFESNQNEEKDFLP